ncbi:MAG: SufE family protein [Bacteroidota bacterium]
MIQNVGIRTIDEIQQEIIAEFKLLDEREDQITYIMEVGETLPPINEMYRTEHNTVQGCMSKVWIACQRNADRLFFEGDSNTAITKGLIGLLVRILSGQTIETIIQANLYFVKEIGMAQLIGSQRSSGFASIVKHIKLVALTQKS